MRFKNITSVAELSLFEKNWIEERKEKTRKANLAEERLGPISKILFMVRIAWLSQSISFLSW
jgi:hypothetical protein